MSLGNEASKKALMAILVAATLAGVIIASPAIFGLLTKTATVGGTGVVKSVGVGVYSDSNCTSPVSSINWGTAEPGTSVNKTVYIRDEGNAPITMSMQTQNWSPANASSYITLSWNYAGGSIQPGQVVTVTLTLSVSAGISGITNYSFDILITATG